VSTVLLRACSPVASNSTRAIGERLHPEVVERARGQGAVPRARPSVCVSVAAFAQEVGTSEVDCDPSSTEPTDPVQVEVLGPLILHRDPQPPSPACSGCEHETPVSVGGQLGFAGHLDHNAQVRTGW
jgi:hypothetical protein